MHFPRRPELVRVHCRWTPALLSFTALVGCVSHPATLPTLTPSRATTPAHVIPRTDSVAPMAWEPPAPRSFVADYDGILLRRPDGTVLRWNGDLRPVAFPPTADVVGFSRERATLTRDRLLDGIVPGRCGIWSVPPVSVRQAIRARRAFVLDADGAVWFADDPARAGPYGRPCQQRSVEPIHLDYRRVEPLRRVRELVSASTSVCVLDEIGDVVCVEPVSGELPTWRFPSSSPVRAAVMGPSNLCVLDSDGALACAAPFSDGPAVHHDTDGFVAIAPFAYGVCGLRADGRVRCVADGVPVPSSRRRRARTGAAPTIVVDATVSVTASVAAMTFDDGRLPVTSRFVVFDAGSAVLACAASDSDDVVCVREENDPEATAVATPGRLERLEDLRGDVVAYDRSGEMSCAIDLAHGLRCWIYVRASALTLERTIEARPDARELIVAGPSVCLLSESRSLRCATVPESPAAAIVWEDVARDVRSFARGPSLVCVVTGDDGALRCRGALRRADDRLVAAFDATQPLTIGGAPTSVRAVAVAARHLCAVLRDGRVACVGDGRDGQLGLGGATLDTNTLRVVAGVMDVRTAIADERSTCAESVSGAVHCWGDGVAFHPVRTKGLDGRDDTELIALSDGRERLNRCQLAQELLCQHSVGRTFAAPWADRPALTVDGGGELVGYQWTASPVRTVCEYERSSGDVRTCYVDAPIAAITPGDVADGSISIDPTPDDFPTFPGGRVASARMYVFASASPSGSCEDRDVSRSSYETCDDLARRGRSLSRAEVRRVLASVNDVDRYPTAAALCHNPHHEIIFFDAAGELLGRLEICFECGTQRGFPEVRAAGIAGSNLHPRGANYAAICRRVHLPLCDPAR